jgi:hypothetical protein
MTDHSQARPEYYVAMLISGLMRYASETFWPNIEHLKRLNPHSEYHAYVAGSPKGQFNFRDDIESTRLLDANTTSTRTELQKLPPLSIAQIHKIYGSHLKGASLKDGPAEFKLVLYVAQSSRLRLMRWRMKHVWTLMAPHMKTFNYKYVIWMRPDTLLHFTVPFDQVDIGEDVHSLVGLPNRDYDFAWWGKPAAMEKAIEEYDESVAAKTCKCTRTHGVGHPTKPPDAQHLGFAANSITDKACFEKLLSVNEGSLLCVFLQALWASRPNRSVYLVGYGASALYGRPPCASVCPPGPASNLFGFKRTVGPWTKCNTNLEHPLECTFRKPFWGPFSVPYGGSNNIKNYAHLNYYTGRIYNGSSDAQ